MAGALRLNVVLSCLAVAAGCAVPAEPPPDISECVIGPAWAECGAVDGPARFACRDCGAPGGRLGPCCAWFAGGRVPEGYVTSDCPETDLCCVGGGIGSPFVAPSMAASFSLASTTSAWGVEPWDRDRERNLEVVLADVLEQPLSVTCSVATGSGPCAARAVLATYRSFGGTLTVYALSAADATYGEVLVLEVIEDDDGTAGARLCRVFSTDYATGQCQNGHPTCATGGAVTIASFPADGEEARALPVDVHASFADGSTIDAHL